ncbi:MAG: STAS domain-containing protein [Actinomycetota bacterium]
MQLLDVRIDERDAWTVVTLTGQLDVATAPGFRQSLQEAQYGGAQRVAVDLSGVEFLDSFGLGVLVGGLRRARLHGGRLVLAAANDRIRAVLEVTSLDTAFELAGDVEVVVAASDAG